MSPLASVAATGAPTFSPAAVFSATERDTIPSSLTSPKTGARLPNGVAVAAGDASPVPRALVALTRTMYATVLASGVMVWDRVVRSVMSCESALDQSVSSDSVHSSV